MTVLWGVLAVVFVLTPTAVGVMLWTKPPRPAKGRVIEFTARKAM